MSFVHLSVHSEFSLNDSLLRVGPMIKKAREFGMPALAVTDTSNMFSAIKVYKEAMAKGVKPIIGAEIRLSTPRLSGSKLTLLCKSNEGYRALCELISRGYAEAPRDENGLPIIPLEWLSGKTSGLIALSGAREGEIGRLLLSKRDAEEALSDMKTLFGEDFYIELQRVGHPADDRYVRTAVELASKTSIPVVATNPARFLSPSDFESHEIRVAIAQGRSLKNLREDLNPPSTQHQYFKSSEEMKAVFADIPSAIQNTVRIAAKCSVDLVLGNNYLPKFPATGGLSEADYLEKTAREGLERRLQLYFKEPALIEQHRKEYTERLEFELKTIKDMGFPGYFLIVADFISWAKSNDIPVGPGRGSGAGSLVAYSLGITDLNPIPYGLLFERFLNPERVSMPDFDVDFCMDKRDRVIQYVADTYGHNAVSQIITFGTMAAKMVVRDVARALGHPYRFGDNLSKMIPKRPDIDLQTAMEEVPSLKLMYESDAEVKMVLDHAMALEGITRQAGKHAGGVLIAPSALTDYTPTYCEPDGSSQVSQYDKDDVEAAGLVKFDFLGLRNLTVINNAVNSINQRITKKGQKAINILDIPLDDKNAYDLLKSCETTAVFQLESSGMKNLIKSLQPDCFEDIVALVALFRPGPLQSGMVDDFVNRKHGRSEVSYPHPLLKPVLETTYGVIVYQEQVMQIAQVLAGYTLGGADMLRRAMGKKKPEEMAKQRSIFVEGAKKNGIPEELAGSIFDLMEKFAEYGFNKSHSAAYALVAYQTAWLKAHYPADFMAAVLSSDMDNTDKVVRFIHECRSMGLKINQPNINLSDWDFTAHNGEIVYGLGAIKGLGESAAKEILEERKRGGEFASLVDFLFRVPLTKRVVEACINAGMFDYTGMDRAELLATYPMALAASKQMKKQAGQGALFDFELPQAPRAEVENMDEQLRLNGERKVLGLYLTGHPYAQYSGMLEKSMSASLAQILANVEDESIPDDKKYRAINIAGMISDIDVKNNSKGNYAFFKLDDNTARVDCRIFTKAYHEYQAFIRDDNMVVMSAKVDVNPKTEAVSLIVDTIQPLDSFMETQSGQMIIELGEGESIAKVLGILHGYTSGKDEGNISFTVRNTDGSLADIPIQGVSYKSAALKLIMNKFGDKATLEFSDATLKKNIRKTSTQVNEVLTQEDMEKERSSLRLLLEHSLSKAESVMQKSVEMSP